jgi:hypothetical protein
MHPEVTQLFNFLPVCNLPLVPTWVLAVVIGVVGGGKLHGLGPSAPGSLTYALTFFMYAAMITSGLFTHCLFRVECGAAPISEGYVMAAMVDASLTACIAISFIFNGLADLRLISDRKFLTLLSMGVTYGGIFFLNFAHLISIGTLYQGSIIIGCSTYLVCQALVLSHRPHLLWPVLYLLGAGASGGISFLLFTEYSCLLCTAFGAWSVEGIWYSGSDLSMLCILGYALVTRERLPTAANSTTSEKPAASARGDSDDSWVPGDMRLSNKVLNGIEKLITRH